MKGWEAGSLERTRRGIQQPSSMQYATTRVLCFRLRECEWVRASIACWNSSQTEFIIRARAFNIFASKYNVIIGFTKFCAHSFCSTSAGKVFHVLFLLAVKYLILQSRNNISNKNWKTFKNFDKVDWSSKSENLIVKFVFADYSRYPDVPDVAPVSQRRSWWCGRANWCIMWRVSLALPAAPRWTKVTISASGTDWCTVGEKQKCLIITILQRPSLLVINEFDDEIDRSTRRFVAPESFPPSPSLPPFFLLSTLLRLMMVIER